MTYDNCEEIELAMKNNEIADYLTSRREHFLSQYYLGKKDYLMQEFVINGLIFLDARGYNNFIVLNKNNKSQEKLGVRKWNKKKHPQIFKYDISNFEADQILNSDTNFMCQLIDDYKKEELINIILCKTLQVFRTINSYRNPNGWMTLIIDNMQEVFAVSCRSETQLSLNPIDRMTQTLFFDNIQEFATYIKKNFCYNVEENGVDTNRLLNGP